jgi:hypothetical protein
MARYVRPHFQRNSNELRDWSYDDAKSKYTTAGLQSKAAVQAAIDTYQRVQGLRSLRRKRPVSGELISSPVCLGNPDSLSRACCNSGPLCWSMFCRGALRPAAKANTRLLCLLSPHPTSGIRAARFTAGRFLPIDGKKETVERLRAQGHPILTNAVKESPGRHAVMRRPTPTRA